jgi:hypothetical protein
MMDGKRIFVDGSCKRGNLIKTDTCAKSLATPASGFLVGNKFESFPNIIYFSQNETMRRKQ